MKKIAYDSLKLDTLKVVEDKKCCLKVNAVITKEGVYPYPDGRAFKSKMELLKATRTARNAKITILDHPDSMVIMSQDQIYGTVEKPFFDRDKIRAVLNFDKYALKTILGVAKAEEYLNKIRQSELKDVSIGFYYQPDFTPGQWNGSSYDYVMRDIVIDHVAAGVLKGRCSFPSCGIGVDTMMRRIALDPFAGYKDFADCVAKNQDKDDPEAYCATIKRKVEDAEKRYTSRSAKGGKKTMSEDESGQTTPEEFAACVAQRMADGYTREEAETYCMAYTKPEDEPTPPPPTKPEEVGKTGGAQEDFDQCVKDKIAGGMTEEEAKEACRGEQPVAEEDQEVEKTELERCIENQMDEGMSAEEARSWCEAEQAGEHLSADALVTRSQQLLRMKEQRDIERNRDRRRHPL